MEKKPYEVIDLSNTGDELQLLKYKFSEIPHIIILPNIIFKELQNLVDKLNDFFIKKGINAISPFPTYLVTPWPIHSLVIPILSKEEYFPNHFLGFKGEKINIKENTTLKKMNIQKEKLKNLNPNSYIFETPRLSLLSKELLQATRVYDFYMEIYRAIRD